MKDPSEVQDVLAKTTHPDVINRTLNHSSGEKRYHYTLEFNDYKTFNLLQKQIKEAEMRLGFSLLAGKMEPVVRQTDSSIEARIKVIIEEEPNRYAEENTQLSEFEE